MKRSARKNGLLAKVLSLGSETTFHYRRGVGVARKGRVESGVGGRQAKRGAGPRPKTVRYRGVSIIPVGDGEYTISIDRDSRFESVKDAKAVIGHFTKKNPLKKSGKAETRRRAIASKRKARRGRKNPDEELQAAAQLSEQFHGRPARRVREVEEVEHGRDTLADLGRMISFTAWVDEDRPFELTFRGVRLACSPDGGQLYLVGNQRLDLEALGLDRYMPKDHITVGPVETIVYHTSKAFHNFEPTDYEHTFAEEGGEQPVLGYDVLSEKFYLTGGSYHVKPEGIVN